MDEVDLTPSQWRFDRSGWRQGRSHILRSTQAKGQQDMKRTMKAVLAAAAVTGVALGGASAAVASTGSGDDGNEVPITGDALDRASALALEHTDGGQVTETEQGDEDSYYEVEVTLDDGRQIDVQLDEDFNVVGSEDDGAGDSD